MDHIYCKQPVVLATELKQNRQNTIFKSATIRLTGWYLLVLMLISVIFSTAIYAITYNEIDLRLGRFQNTMQQSDYFITRIDTPGVNIARNTELKQARQNLIFELLCVNLVILVTGGVFSYFLAKRNLSPLEKAHEEQSRFTSDASHELRTPLAVMKTEIEVALRDKKASSKELKETLTSNLEEVDKLSKLAEMLLNLSRLDNDKLEFRLVDFSKIAEETICSYKQPKTRIEILSKKQIKVKGNEIALADLVKILVDNAIKYSPSDSLISISLSDNDKHVVLKVKNTGPGISPEKIEHIFERFYRADNSRTGNKKSYGLGLSLAKKIVALHKGQISAKSIPDVETIFTVILPVN